MPNPKTARACECPPFCLRRRRRSLGPPPGRRTALAGEEIAELLSTDAAKDQAS